MTSNISEKWQKINGHYTPGRKYSAISYNAERRGIEFNVSLDYLDELWEAQDGRCYYTDDELDITSRSGATASLERLNSKIGYIEGNVVWACVKVNLAKHVMTEDEFYDLVRKVYEHKIRGKEINIL